MLQWLAAHLALGAVGTWLAMRYAVGRNLFDQPGTRRSHQVATARGGGVAIAIAVLVAAAVLALRGPEQGVLLWAFAAGLVLVAGVGMVDDHRPLSPWWRLAAHLVAACLIAFAVARSPAGWPWAAVAFVAAVVLTNVWNFMDGINGLAASQAIIIAALVAWLAPGTWGWVAAALAAACLGFLPYNFPRARIFLGDVGSGAIGFAVAVLCVIGVGQRHGNWSWLLVFPLSAFLVDAGLTLMRRVLRAERWWTPHTQHAYQVWSRRSGHPVVTIAYGAWTMAGALVMLAGLKAPVHFMLYLALAWYTVTGSLWWLMQRMEAGNTIEGGQMDGDQS